MITREGFWSIVFTGAIGTGAGVLVFDSGLLVGADNAGGIIDGTYGLNEHGNRLELKAKWTATRPNITLVQGGGPLPIGASFPMEGSVSRYSEIEEQFLVQTGRGSVVVKMRKIRSFPSGA